MEFWVVILLLVIGLPALWLIFMLGKAAIVGAIGLFTIASEEGFVGLVAYAAAWMFLFPLMLIACIGVGVYVMWGDYRFLRHMRLATRRMRDSRRNSNSDSARGSD